MKRQITLDTETTGLEVGKGHRVIEIGAVEIVDQDMIATYNVFINPGRSIDLGSYAVHGICEAQLEGRPTFKEIAPVFLNFIRDAELLIHNAKFDVEMLDAELERAGLGRLLDYCASVTCTLDLARSLFPHDRHTLDHLCDRYGVDRRHRVKHGALVDADLLAKVYMEMVKDCSRYELESV